MTKKCVHFNFASNIIKWILTTFIAATKKCTEIKMYKIKLAHHMRSKMTIAENFKAELYTKFLRFKRITRTIKDQEEKQIGVCVMQIIFE